MWATRFGILDILWSISALDFDVTRLGTLTGSADEDCKNLTRSYTGQLLLSDDQADRC